MLYIKWLTESSNFAYDQGGVPVLKSQEYPETLAAFDGIELLEDTTAPDEIADLAVNVQQEAELTLLSRPSDSGHTPFGDIFLSQSPDMEFWGRHRHVMGKSGNWWENLKIGGGAAPIETSEGWLLFYHGVTGTCNGYVYSIGGAILDRDEPSRVLHRCSTFLLTPETDYEERGFVPNVCFPCATLQDAATGRIALYYGCADSYVGLAFTTADEVVDYIKAHDQTSDADRELGLR